MKKFFVLIIIFLLVISTAIIKNTTKKIEDEIFSIKENLRVLKNEYKYILLENSYLGSSEKLFKFQELYFENALNEIDLEDLRILKFNSKGIDIKNIKFEYLYE